MSNSLQKQTNMKCTKKVFKRNLFVKNDMHSDLQNCHQNPTNLV